jgi:hypothetical protein
MLFRTVIKVFGNISEVPSEHNSEIPFRTWHKTLPKLPELLSERFSERVLEDLSEVSF